MDWSRWSKVLQAVHNPKHEVTIGLVGKYIDLPDAYLSRHRGAQGRRLRARDQGHRRLDPVRPVRDARGRARRRLRPLDGIVIPGGFGIRGIEGKLGALRFAREQGIPTLGICLGLQCMVIEYARNEAGLAGASSTEFDPDTEYPVIATMEEQVDILEHGDLGGTMRLGLYPADLAEGSLAAELYGATRASERHRHRYEVNNRYRGQLCRGRARVLGPVARPQPRRVRRAAAGRAPVLHRHAGPPRAAFAADGAAPAVPRARRARRSSGTARASCSRSRATDMEPLRDEPVDADVVSSDVVYRGRVWDVRADAFRYGGQELRRQYVDHPGAAAIIALDDGGPRAADPAVPASDPPSRLGGAGRAARRGGGVSARDGAARARRGGRPHGVASGSRW